MLHSKALIMYWCISEKCIVNTDAFCEGIVEGTVN